MITNENIQKFKNYGLVLTPVNKTNDIKDKSPVVKNGSWSLFPYFTLSLRKFRK